MKILNRFKNWFIKIYKPFIISKFEFQKVKINDEWWIGITYLVRDDAPSKLDKENNIAKEG